MKTIIIIIMLSAFSAYGQGYCSLRNPQAKIKAFFPNCHGYKTLVSTVDNKVKVKIDALLPFSIHHFEIGRHNLYTINSKTQTEGFVHARSEQSRWGLVEIVWSLNLDLTVKDFDFQRCRSHYKSDLLKDDFKKQIIGKNFYELRTFIKENGKLNNGLKVDTEALELAQLVIQSALKTIALTELVWAYSLKRHEPLPSTHNPPIALETALLKDIKINKASNTFTGIHKDSGLLIRANIKNVQVTNLFIPINKKLLNINTLQLRKEIISIIK